MFIYLSKLLKLLINNNIGVFIISHTRLLKKEVHHETENRRDSDSSHPLDGNHIRLQRAALTQAQEAGEGKDASPHQGREGQGPRSLRTDQEGAGRGAGLEADAGSAQVLRCGLPEDAQAQRASENHAQGYRQARTVEPQE